LKRNARAKRLTLRLSQADGTATLTLPSRTPIRQAEAFARKQENWLRSQMAKLPEFVPLQDGNAVMFRGTLHEIVSTSGKSVHVDAARIIVGGPHTGARLRAFLKTEARNALLPAVERYAAMIDTPFERVTLRDTRSRWGSCSSSGGLMFSWRLVMAPPDVLSYVAAHEVAHLVEMNHSAKFWAVVGKLMPEYENHRHWLREHGGKLHRYDFSS